LAIPSFKFNLPSDFKTIHFYLLNLLERKPISHVTCYIGKLTACKVNVYKETNDK